MKVSKAQVLARRIDEHGQQLLTIFPRAIQRDPAKLCRMLRRLETEAHRLAEEACNGEPDRTKEEMNALVNAILSKVRRVLSANELSPQIVFNGDPRGYALKIPKGVMLGIGLALHCDWGGNGILAPDFAD